MHTPNTPQLPTKLNLLHATSLRCSLRWLMLKSRRGQSLFKGYCSRGAATATQAPPQALPKEAPGLLIKRSTTSRWAAWPVAP